MNNIAGLTPLTPIIGGFTTPIVYLVSKSRRAVFAYALFLALLTMALSLLVVLEVYEGGSPIVYNAGGWPGPVGIVYVVDEANALLGLLTSTLILLVLFYSYEYITDAGYPWYL
ncbi:MAG: cation:proton antiporter, partial [Thermogladius sp.]|nr:cation:proton antiporter [Thermogladius sp.]